MAQGYHHLSKLKSFAGASVPIMAQGYHHLSKLKKFRWRKRPLVPYNNTSNIINQTLHIT
jgi:hypothetical protein